MDSFINCDPTMPKKLKLHFYDLERQVVQYLSWDKTSPVVQKIEQILEK
jgi:hypothetical protein